MSLMNRLLVTLLALPTSLSHVLSNADHSTDEQRVVSASTLEDGAPMVTLDSGTVAGSTTGSVNRFLGIPFAAPPIRFDPPRPAGRFRGTFDATRQMPACIQKFKYPEEAREREMEWFNTPPPPAGESEDCLYLDIYSPANATAGSKPVLFWLYGGGFSFGTATLSQYSGTSFAQNQDIVIVAPNYRTNVFGFPGSPEKPMAEQNLGLLDARFALNWVQQNIRAFGGDPKKVTIFGESAGSGIVETLVIKPPMPLPFRAAIMQSGVASIALPNQDSANSWKKLAKAVNCAKADSTLACMRQVPAATIKNISEHQKLDFSPIFERSTYPNNGRINRRRSTQANPRIARVPMLVGSNADEGGPFVYGQTDPRAFLSMLLPQSVTGLLDVLLGGYSTSGGRLSFLDRRLATIVTDFAFQCPTKLVAEEGVKSGIPSWRYYFDAAFNNTQIFPNSGAFHSSEIYLIFGTYPRSGATAYQMKLSQALQKVWADFAKNPSQGPGWEQAPKIAVLGAASRKKVPARANSPIKTVVKPNKIDRRCILYRAIYDAATLLL
ncbi:hypothetical protein HIM_06191 [Hirsutella minnesotensis 3608]|uniref:Carboxylic ester hydrolase n=1 Tax=Hirsutella minnesotensis 3608 TaxID=1043627 RepID=A0A0F7ZJG7_9HYPO|nr:hypothetical protein HIM_06191 [Hirsutella minnesotensis 3608]